MRVNLPKHPQAPLLARALVRQNLCEGHSQETRDEVELLVSELVHQFRPEEDPDPMPWA